MERERPVRQRREVDHRHEERDRRRTALDHDLAAATEALHVDLDPGTRLVAAAQQQERVVGEAGLARPEEPHGPGHLQTVHEAHDDVRVTPKRPAQTAELPVDDGRVGRARPHETHAGDAMDVVVDGGCHLPVLPRRAGETPRMMAVPRTGDRGRRGFTVALIGCDGAGKTTVARALERTPDLPVRYLYMGVSAESSNRRLPTTRIAHAVKRRRDDAPPAASRGHPRACTRRTCRAGRAGLRLANRLAEEWYRQLIAQRYVARGWVVVFDRHFLADYHASDVAGVDRPLSRRIHGWMLAHAYPRPDLVILLDAPPEVLHARKGEGTLASLARRRADYLGLGDAGCLDRAPSVVPATQELPAVVADVAGLIRDAARSR